MLLTLFLSMVVCGAVSLMMISAIAFIQDTRLFSSAPKEARAVLIPRDKELFYGARAIGWVLMVLSILLILGALAIAIWDGFRSGFTFGRFFMRLAVMLSVYKLYDMVFFDYYLLMKFHFFQHYYPEVKSVFDDPNRRYGFNIKSQLVKLFVAFPAISALVAWICTLLK